MPPSKRPRQRTRPTLQQCLLGIAWVAIALALFVPLFRDEHSRLLDTFAVALLIGTVGTGAYLALLVAVVRVQQRTHADEPEPIEPNHLNPLQRSGRPLELALFALVFVVPFVVLILILFNVL